MPSLISTSEKISLRASIKDVFDSFSREINIVLKPVQTIDISSQFSSVYGRKINGNKTTQIPNETTVQSRVLYKNGTQELFDKAEASLKIVLPVGSVRLEIMAEDFATLKNAIMIKIDSIHYELVSGALPIDLFGEIHRYFFFAKPING